MAKVAIRGKFPFKESEKLSKKAKKKKIIEELRKKDKRLRMQCECNHIDAKKGKTHFKTSDDGVYRICKICGGHLIKDTSMITKEAIESARDILYTFFGSVRSRFPFDEKTYDSITTTLHHVMRAPEIYEQMIKEHAASNGKKKKDNKKKKNKKKNKKRNRISY